MKKAILKQYLPTYMVMVILIIILNGMRKGKSYQKSFVYVMTLKLSSINTSTFTMVKDLTV